MALEKLEVVEFILTTFGAGDFMIDFQPIPVFEKQMAAGPFSLLSLEQQSDS
jgi:hypothetical protein